MPFSLSQRERAGVRESATHFDWPSLHWRQLTDLMPTKPTSSARAVERREPGPMMRELQRRAEAQLKKQRNHQAANGDDPRSVTDPRRQFHELQVQQVELELQNNALRQTRDELELALENYTELYDFAPVGYFTLTADSTIQQANLTGANLVGIDRSRLVGRGFDQHFAAGLPCLPEKSICPAGPPVRQL
jgi:PAS domain-containing protein